MAGIRGSEGGSLQELIDSYNSELMRYHAQAGREEPSAAAMAETAPPRSTIALDNEALAVQQQRQQSQQRLTQEQQWLMELEAGLRELEAGLRELEEGLRELREGERQLALGREEYQQWNSPQAAVAAAATPMAAPMTPGRSDAPTEQGTGIPAVDVGGGNGLSNQGGAGYLQVFAYTARQARLERGADVTVIRRENGEDTLYAVTRTDNTGRTPLIRLPADSRKDTATPIPSLYYVTVTVDGYAPQDDLPVQIYPDITATLPVELIPLSQSQQMPRGGVQ
ncbi:MAG: hypothetical protein E7559_10720 [Ruminococcaceae bacterium]|nr:hypothetical protein [Oscillospiraceae bacterium]